MVAFNTVPDTLRVPGNYVEVDGSNALSATPAQRKRALIIGLRKSTGSVLEAVPTRIVGETVADAYFGTGSQIAEMCRYYRRVDPLTELVAIALDEASAGTAATGKFAVATAVATKAGTLYVYVGDRRVAVAVDVDDDEDAVAAAIVAAITADKRIAVTAVVNGTTASQVDLTANHKGAYGNQIPIGIAILEGDTQPSDLGVGAITVTAMASGATNPDMADAIAVFADETYDVVVTGFDDDTNMDLLEAEMADRWGALSEHPGHIYTATRGAHATLTTYGNARNSQYSTVEGYAGHSSEPWKWAAQVAGASAAESHPARPRNTLVLPDIMAPAKADRFDIAERNLLLWDGISTYVVDDGGRVRIDRLITTYQTNAQSVDDPTFLDETTMLKLAWMRGSLRSRLSKYQRHSIADDGTVVRPGVPVTTPSEIRGDIIDLATNEWVPFGIMEGGAKLDTFAEQLVVERNAGDVTRVDVQLPPDLTNDLHIIANQIAFRL